MSVHTSIQQGFRALEAWSWQGARAAFEEAVATEESPEALEGLGVAAGWLDDAATSIDARERAFHLYRDRGDAEAAARVAGSLADALLTFRGESAVAAGWLQRARRVLADRPDSPVLAWIDALEAFLAMAYERDVPRAMERGGTAVARARRLGATDMEMVALSILGVVLVASGRFDDGMRMLDEATASAAAGDIKDPEAAANIYCALVTASVRVRDLDRLAQWSRHVMDFSRGWPNRAVFSYPRTEHAVALTWWGRWREAERELESVISDMDGRPLLAALAMLRLADLRRRQGRFEEAWSILDRLDERPGGVGMGHLTGAVRAAVALDRGDPAHAADLAERYLRAIPNDDIYGRFAMTRRFGLTSTRSGKRRLRTLG
jgi:LuxR family transcriptional regulator, maltose regulon positive regulatory protein